MRGERMSMEKSEALYMVVPAYNEAENIRKVIEEWYPVVERTGKDSRLVVIDDGSRDNTYRIMLECAKNRAQFVPLTKKNSGHGATVLYGYHYALDKGADYIFQTDSDGQTLPEEFGAFWDMRQKYDMVIGHRNKRGDGFSRIFVTKVLKAVIRLCFHVSVVDANTPYRLMKASALKEDIGLIPKDFNLSNVLISVIYEKKGRSVKYIPITFRPRQGGKNSINFKKIIPIGKQAVKDFIRINRTLNQI